VLLLGVVSLFADATYEGARSITGPFLAFLGASATVTGAVAGLAELTAYALRLAFGYLADRTRWYWPLTLLGYGINLLAVPLLALAGRWEIAAFLIVMERFGKALRTPARDAMLSYATARMGHGWGFGLHEAMDQIGAVTGPLIVALVLALNGGYRESFAMLAVPAVLALAVLVVARWLYPQPRELEARGSQPPAEIGGGLPRVFWLYVAFVAVSIAGFAHFQLMSYHFTRAELIPAVQVPVLFAVAMGVDALVALLVGRWFDEVGLLALVLVPVASLPIAPLVFTSSAAAVVVGLILWGAVMGMQETIMRAAVAKMIPLTHRGTAYGTFNAAYGVFWFLGSLAMGVLYDFNLAYLIVFSIALELLSLPVLFLVQREVRVST